MSVLGGYLPNEVICTLIVIGDCVHELHSAPPTATPPEQMNTINLHQLEYEAENCALIFRLRAYNIYSENRGLYVTLMMVCFSVLDTHKQSCNI